MDDNDNPCTHLAITVTTLNNIVVAEFGDKGSMPPPSS